MSPHDSREQMLANIDKECADWKRGNVSKAETWTFGSHAYQNILWLRSELDAALARAQRAEQEVLRLTDELDKLDAEAVKRVEQTEQERDEARKEGELQYESATLSLVERDEARARVVELEKALTEAEEKLAAVFGRNHALLLTPEQIGWLMRELGHFPVTNQIAGSINDELHRAKRYDKRAVAAGRPEGSAQP